jgi:AraC-like DNA-binding protein
VFSFGKYYCPEGIWRGDSVLAGGDVIGPIAFPGPPSVPARAESVGAYFCAGAVIPGAPSVELANRVVALEDLWGASARQTRAELCDVRSEAVRLDRLESALVQRVAAARQPRGTSLHISGLAAWIFQSAGQLTVERLSEAAGLSRRHLTRVFREHVGVSPKLLPACSLPMRACPRSAWQGQRMGPGCCRVRLH